MRKYLTILILFGLVAATGCRSAKEAAKKERQDPETSASAPTRPISRNYSTTNLTCEIKGSVINGQLRMLQDSIIWATANKFIELGRAKLTPDSVVIYLKVANRCFRGDYQDLFKRIGIRTSFAEIQEMITAEDADNQINAMVRRMNIGAQVHLQGWAPVPSTTFPLVIPATVKPL